MEREREVRERVVFWRWADLKVDQYRKLVPKFDIGDETFRASPSQKSLNLNFRDTKYKFLF